jgi:hypothetical protein
MERRSRPDYNQQGCALATDTPTPAVNHDLVEHDQPNHEGNSCKQSKNKQEQDKQATKLQIRDEVSISNHKGGVLEQVERVV